MKLLRMKTLGMLGIGFLAGSAAGRGPWEKAQGTIDQVKDKVGGGHGDGYGSTSNGIDGQGGGQGSVAHTDA